MTAPVHKFSPQLLSQVPTPLPGEHLAGYLRRLTERNRFPSLRSLTRTLDIVDMTPRSAERLWARLAERLNVDLKFVTPLRWQQPPSEARRWLTFFGHEVHESYIEMRQMRLCTRCVDETGTLFGIWAMKHVTACQVHGTLLRGTCPGCGKTLRLHAHYSWTCTQCGADFRDGQDEAAQEHETAIAASLAAAAAGTKSPPSVVKHFPRSWHRAPLQERLATIEYLGRLTMLRAADHIPAYIKRKFAPLVVDLDRSDAEHRSITKNAAGILADWPKAFYELLEPLVDRNPEPSTSNPLTRRFSTAAGLFAIRGMKDRGGGDLPLICEARQRFLEQRISYRPGGRDLLRRYTPHKEAAISAPALISTARTGELLGTGPGGLKALHKAGLLSPFQPRRHVLAWRAEEVETLKAKLADLPKPSAKALDLVSVAELLTRSGVASCYPRHRMLHDIVSGLLPAFSTGATLADTFFEKSDLEYMTSVHQLREWIEEGFFRELQFFNPHSFRVWGPMGLYKMREAKQLAAAGEVACIETKYLVNGSWPGRRFLVSDLVRHIQAAFGPRHFDLEDSENPLRFDASALR